MKRIMVLLTIFSVLLATLLTACGKPQESVPSVSPDVENVEESVEAVFPTDEVVNNFIITYNSLSNSPIIYIEQGNIKSKCYGHTYDHRIEILNGADNTLHITIEADYNHPDMTELRDAFRDVMLALDPTLTDEEAFNAFDEATNNPSSRSNMELGNVAYNCYWTVELSNGNRSFGRIEADLPLE